MRTNREIQVNDGANVGARKLNEDPESLTWKAPPTSQFRRAETDQVLALADLFIRAVSKCWKSLNPAFLPATNAVLSGISYRQ